MDFDFQGTNEEFLYIDYTVLSILVFIMLLILAYKLYKWYPWDLQKKYLIHIEKKSNFYQNLTEDSKRKFGQRVRKFIDTKLFIGRDGVIITDEIEALVSASAIQLSYGHSNVKFRHFNKIIIYPHSYRSRITKELHDGEVNAAGIIVLSWEAFEFGYRDNEDGRNLGLHEMAHALYIENRLPNGEYDFINNKAIKELKKFAAKEKELIIEIQSKSIYRRYAATNFQEFFAVSTEYFFEQPIKLYNYNSKIFELMKIIYNIDTREFLK